MLGMKTSDANQAAPGVADVKAETVTAHTAVSVARELWRTIHSADTGPAPSLFTRSAGSPLAATWGEFRRFSYQQSAAHSQSTISAAHYSSLLC